MTASLLNVTLSGPAPLPYLREFILTQTVLLPLWPAIILFGLFANTTNMVVFLKAGVEDSVSTLLLSLSVSDFTFLTLIAPSVCSFVIFRFAPTWRWPFDFGLTAEMPYWLAFTIYDFSSFVSVLLGVTRCACVAMPLQFKSVFTKARTLKLAAVLFILAVSLHIPVLQGIRIEWRTDPRTNSSRLEYEISNSKSVMRVNDILNRNSVPWINFIIMVTCVALLSFKLLQASRVRKSHTASTPASAATAAGTTTADSGDPASKKRGTEGGHSGLSARDIHVIQSVVLVCSIFIAAHLPFLTYSAARLINPEFDLHTRLHYLFSIASTVSITCSCLNASVNIFVYYNYNSKFRAVLLSTFNLTASETS